MSHSPSRPPEQGNRPRVAQIHVRPDEVWFHCPGCGAALDGYLMDPRGTEDVICEECGTEFDIPPDAGVVIV